MDLAEMVWRFLAAESAIHDSHANSDCSTIGARTSLGLPMLS